MPEAKLKMNFVSCLLCLWLFAFPQPISSQSSWQDLTTYTEWFPSADPGDGSVSTVSCGGVEKMAQGVSMAGYTFITPANLVAGWAAGMTLQVSGVVCLFSDNTRKLLGTAQIATAPPVGTEHPNLNIGNYSGAISGVIGDPGTSSCMLDMSKSPVKSIELMTNSDASQLCWTTITLEDDASSNDNACGNGQSWCDNGDTDPQTQTTTDVGLLVDIKALLDADTGALLSLSYGYISGQDWTTTITSLSFTSLQSQPGPFPAYNLGVIWDNTNADVSGSMSASLTIESTLLAQTAAADTVGESTARSLQLADSVPKMPIPTYTNTNTWKNSSTTTDTQTTELTSTVAVAPKISVAAGEYGQLVNLLYNGSSQLPFTAEAEVSINGQTTAFSFPGVYQMSGSLSFYSVGGNSSSGGGSADPGSWTPVDPPSPVENYPWSEPLVYSWPLILSDSPNTTNISSCGSMMQRGGVQKLKVYVINSNICAIELISPAGDSEICGTVMDGADSDEVEFSAGEYITTFTVRRPTPGNFPPFAITCLDISTNKNPGTQTLPAVDYQNCYGQPLSVSVLGLGSGQLDGFVYQTFSQGIYGDPVTYTYLLAPGCPSPGGMPPCNDQFNTQGQFSPVFIQPYNSVSMEVTSLDQSVPVQLPTATSQFTFTGVDSAPIDVTWEAKTSYSFGTTNTITEQYSNKVGLAWRLPVIPLTAKGDMTWTSDTSTQTASTSTLTQTVTSSVSFDVNFPSEGPSVSGTLLLYDTPVTLGMNGLINMTFASGYHFSYQFPDQMGAQDGRYAVFSTINVDSTSGNRRKLVEAGANAGHVTIRVYDDDCECMVEFTAKQLLDMPLSSRIKHRALAFYEVTHATRDWCHVAELLGCDVSIIKALNPEHIDESLPDKMVPLEQLMGKKIMITHKCEGGYDASSCTSPPPSPSPPPYSSRHWSQIDDYGNYLEIPACRYSLWECYHFEVTGNDTDLTFYNRAQLSGNPDDFALYLAAFNEQIADMRDGIKGITVGEVDVTYLVMNSNLTHARTKLEMVFALGETLDDTIMASGIVVVDLTYNPNTPDVHPNVTMEFEALAITGGTGRFQSAGGQMELLPMAGTSPVGQGWEIKMFVPRDLPIDAFDEPHTD